MKCNVSLPVLLILFIALIGSVGVHSAPKLNPAAQALARHLGPSRPTEKFNPADTEELSRRMITVIELVHSSDRGNGPGPESLLDKAFEFRPDVGPWERLMVSRAVINAWSEASAMNLFGKDGKFGDRIHKGRHEGGRVVFELIIPGEAYPPGSNQFANLRLVPDSEKRTKAIEPNHREVAFQEQLAKLVNEQRDYALAANKAKQARKDDAKREAPATNALGQSQKEQDKIWEEAATLAGDKVKMPPNIRVKGAKEASPSKMTQNRWRVGARVHNTSYHPTEVKAEVWILGITDRKRDYYVMSRSEHTLKLRQGEARDLDFFTRAENSYKNKADDHDGVPKNERNRTKVNYHGFAIRVFFNDDLVAATASNARLASWVGPGGDTSELSRLPKF
ncbi:MAG: hypothetical protein CMO61_11075 [Verrucomicrobiales bacterium]|jgi:hypothetical protein|nr:hypothetical protein [Verrucomicrobiales bacterium]|tara:strand:- start:2885 stop:4063 length:1179 start_codon:yes stop_codon:yes gene_type:complete